MSMTVRRSAPVALALLTLTCAAPASAQKVTTVPDLTLEQTLVQLLNPLGVGPVGQAVGLTTAIEIATAPFGTSSGGFVFKLDPATGLLARTATTFGPSFTERALTLGEGKVNVGATFAHTTYDELSNLSLSHLPIGSVNATSPAASSTGLANLRLTSKTLALSGAVGVTDKLDVSVIVPLVSITLEGTSTLTRGDGVVTRLAETNGSFSGLGDMAAMAKFRVLKFGKDALPDPGGIALLVNMRLPTGDRDNLRGLGVYRTMVAGAVSGGKGKFQPHGTIGFEYWSKSVGVASPVDRNVSVRHQVQYAAGIELEATPKLTLLVDFLGQQILDGGQVGFVDVTSVASGPGITSVHSLAALQEGISKALLVPGLKVNVKGKLLLSLNALVTLHNSGLHSKVTPVVGINLTM